MDIRTAFLVTLALVSSAFAQGNTIPPGFASKEAGNQARYLGGFPNMRAQLASGFYKKRLTMAEVQLRQDGYFSSSHAVARTWSNVELRVANSDFTRISTTFANNIIGTPTTVFSNSVTWPALTSKSLTVPGIWAAGGLKIPYTSPYIHSGTNDLLLDLTFSGGVLSNSARWLNLTTYYLDGLSYQTVAGGASARFGLSHCRAYRGQGRAPDVFAFAVATYAKNIGGTSLDHTISGFLTHSNGSPSNVHIGAIGVTGVTSPSQGTSVGTCQLLMMTPLIYTSFTTDGGGRWTGPRSTIAFNPNLVGLNLWTQAAHSGANNINLSIANRSIVAGQPALPDYRMIYVSVASNPWGWVNTTDLPIVFLK